MNCQTKAQLRRLGRSCREGFQNHPDIYFVLSFSILHGWRITSRGVFFFSGDIEFYHDFAVAKPTPFEPFPYSNISTGNQVESLVHFISKYLIGVAQTTPPALSDQKVVIPTWNGDYDTAHVVFPQSLREVLILQDMSAAVVNRELEVPPCELSRVMCRISFGSSIHSREQIARQSCRRVEIDSVAVSWLTQLE